MRVVVLGAGVVGVASAWYLAATGHEVEVIDRASGPAEETSFANAGQVSPGLSAPWAGPDTPRKAFVWLAMRHSPLVIRPRPDPALVEWLARFLANCNEAAYARNKSRMVRVAEYSRDRLRDLRHVTGIQYDDRQLGLLQLFREEKQLDDAARDTMILERAGVAHRILDRAGCIAHEPGLAKAHSQFAGGLLLPGDETGDARLFTQNLAAVAGKTGVTFRFGTTIRRLRAEAQKITAIETDAGAITADRYVLALGSYSPILLRPLGIRLPVYPVKGYSLTVPITDESLAPRSTIMDETYKVGITRLGNRIRVGGTAELAGYSRRLREPRRRTLTHSLTDLFPHAGDLSAASFWTGLRPMTPDGTPIIGPTKYRNLWLNTGHGTLGWTMACGSGALIADLVSDRRPNIEYADLSIDRYH